MRIFFFFFFTVQLSLLDTGYVSPHQGLRAYTWRLQRGSSQTSAFSLHAILCNSREWEREMACCLSDEGGAISFRLTTVNDPFNMRPQRVSLQVTVSQRFHTNLSIGNTPCIWDSRGIPYLREYRPHLFFQKIWKSLGCGLQSGTRPRYQIILTSPRPPSYTNYADFIIQWL